jgi:hypothetical protein
LIRIKAAAPEGWQEGLGRYWENIVMAVDVQLDQRFHETVRM